jgi:hypothetical protein
MTSVTRTARSAGHCTMILRHGPHFCLAEGRKIASINTSSGVFRSIPN